MILGLQQGLAEEGLKVSLVKLCQWFEMPRRTVYYRSTKAAPKVQAFNDTWEWAFQMHEHRPRRSE